MQHSDREQELENEVELLRQQLEALKGDSEELGVIMAKGKGITHRMAFILVLLTKRAPAIVSKGTLHVMLYGDREDGGPEPKIFAVLVNRLRDWLRRVGCKGRIITIWGAGYRADPELVEWVKRLQENKEN